MTGSIEFSLLNLDKLSRTVGNPDLTATAYIQIDFLLSNKVKIEKRQVVSLPSLLGEIGGLNEIFASSILLLISNYQTNIFRVDSVKRNFLVSKT